MGHTGPPLPTPLIRTVGAWGLGLVPRRFKPNATTLVRDTPHRGGMGGSAPQHNPERAGLRFPQASSPRVEVPGIEPGSSVALPGLLRAQFTVSLLDPTGHVNKPM